MGSDNVARLRNRYESASKGPWINHGKLCGKTGHCVGPVGRERMAIFAPSHLDAAHLTAEMHAVLPALLAVAEAAREASEAANYPDGSHSVYVIPVETMDALDAALAQLDEVQP